MADMLRPHKVPIPVKSFITSGGTWNFNGNTGIPYLSHTAADDSPVLTIPIPAPSSHEAGQGSKLTSIDIPIRATTQNFDTVPTVVIYRRNMLALTDATVDLTATTIPCTVTGATVTADANDRLITATVTTPALDYDTEDKASYYAVLSLDAGTATVLNVYDAIAYYQVTT